MFADLGHFNKKSIQVMTNMLIFLPYYIDKKPFIYANNALPFVPVDGILVPGLSITDTRIRWPGSISDQEPIEAQHNVLQQRPRATVLAGVRRSHFGCHRCEKATMIGRKFCGV